MTVAAFVPNVFDRGRFGDGVTFVDSPEQVAAIELAVGSTLFLVDLDRCDDIAAFAVPGVHLIGFGPHVDSDAQTAAIAAGYHEVLPRSLFFRRLPEILERHR